jgi:hypothetical protein
MKSAATGGEPEVAVVGAVSAIEWFANRFVEPPNHPFNKSHSLRKALKMPPLNQLPEDLKNRLLATADLRNDLVHGKPPARDVVGKREGLEHVDVVLRNGLDFIDRLTLGNLRPLMDRRNRRGVLVASMPPRANEHARPFSTIFQLRLFRNPVSAARSAR